MARDEHVTERKILQEGSVYIEKSLTKNLGDFNSAKVTVGITVPLDADDEFSAKVRVAVRKGSRLIDQAIEKEIDALLDE